MIITLPTINKETHFNVTKKEIDKITISLESNYMFIKSLNDIIQLTKEILQYKNINIEEISPLLSESTICLQQDNINNLYRNYCFAKINNPIYLNQYDRNIKPHVSINVDSDIQWNIKQQLLKSTHSTPSQFRMFTKDKEQVYDQLAVNVAKIIKNNVKDVFILDEQYVQQIEFFHLIKNGLWLKGNEQKLSTKIIENVVRREIYHIIDTINENFLSQRKDGEIKILHYVKSIWQ